MQAIAELQWFSLTGYYATHDIPDVAYFYHEQVFSLLNAT
jgi:hypothetical protein